MHAIVSGANGNLGKAVVTKFLQEGYAVSGTVIPQQAGATLFDNENFAKKVIDLADENATLQMVKEIVEKEGSIDIAVLTVGGFAMGDIEHTTSADILKQYQLNFETTYHLARPVFLQMLKQGSGRIFFIASRPGLDSSKSKGMVAYGLSKTLVIRLSELLNHEAKGKDIVSTVVVPSTIDTPENRKSMPDANFASWVRAEDIANIIYLHTTPDMKVLRETVLKVYGNS